MEKESMIERIKEFFEDTWSNMAGVYRSFRSWFSHCAKHKPYWKLIHTSMKSHPWDFGFLYELELSKLTQMYDYFSTAQILVPESYERKCNELRWAINCLRIYLDKDHIAEYTPNEQYTNYGSEDKPVLISGYDAKYLRHINTKNAHRFLNEIELKYLHDTRFDTLKEDYYQRKALTLYHKIREQYTLNWWD